MSCSACRVGCSSALLEAAMGRRGGRPVRKPPPHEACEASKETLGNCRPAGQAMPMRCVSSRPRGRQKQNADGGEEEGKKKERGLGCDVSYSWGWIDGRSKTTLDKKRVALSGSARSSGKLDG